MAIFFPLVINLIEHLNAFGSHNVQTDLIIYLYLV